LETYEQIERFARQNLLPIASMPTP
jgi:hypothetical protein